ncbi:phospho-N-acetylmuramoyl-pentapeptide-transferase [Candidatus Bipolaricaulota sp. J31]
MEALRFGGLLGLSGGIVAALAVWAFICRPLYGQHVRPEGLPTHHKKAGTPTMGGLPLLLLFLLAWGAAPLWPVDVSWRGWFVFSSAMGAGAIGFLDDLLSGLKHRSEGLSPSGKLLLQAAVGLGLFLLLFLRGSDLLFHLPFSSVVIPLRDIPAPALFVLVLLGFMGTANGANLIDGLDGLAAGCGVSILLGALALTGGYPELSALSLLGAGLFLGFLWWNRYPARVFMGDTGSMFLGGLIFGVFVAAGGLFLIPLSAGIFVVESLSVIVQVAAFKLRRVRVFKMSPLHHHLEEGEVPWRYLIPSPGWPEPVVVARLWIISVLFVVVGILATR